LRAKIAKTLIVEEPCRMRSMMIEKAAMNVVRERDGDVATLEWSVEHARYDEARRRRADRLDRKERYWGSLLSYLISYQSRQA
jgi:hypothetical protein